MMVDLRKILHWLEILIFKYNEEIFTRISSGVYLEHCPT